MPCTVGKITWRRPGTALSGDTDRSNEWLGHRGQVPQYFRVPGNNFEQRCGSASRAASSLLPLLKRARRNVQYRRELRLRQSGLEARRHDVVGINAVLGADFAALDVANSLQQLRADVAGGVACGNALLASHGRAPLRSCAGYVPG